MWIYRALWFFIAGLALVFLGGICRWTQLIYWVLYKRLHIEEVQPPEHQNCRSHTEPPPEGPS